MVACLIMTKNRNHILKFTIFYVEVNRSIAENQIEIIEIHMKLVIG